MILTIKRVPTYVKYKQLVISAKWE